MITVRQILKSKGKQVHSVTPSATVQDALKVMSDKDIGAVLVMEGEKIKGIFSERDYARRTTLEGCVDLYPVDKLMTRALIYAGMDQSVEECMELMNAKGIRHLPVYENGDLLGLISIRDVLREVIAEQKTMISHLENYISGL